MLEFQSSSRNIVIKYQVDFGSNDWVWSDLKAEGEVRLRRTFNFIREDLIQEPELNQESDLARFSYRFVFAVADGDYFRIAGRKLGIENDVCIARGAVTWSHKLFVAAREISIFRRIAELIESTKTIYIGGDIDGAIPVQVFSEMLKKFPNSTELNHYASARIANVIGEYLDPHRDFRAQYERYLSRRKSIVRDLPLRAENLIVVEIEKFVLIRDTIRAWLSKEQRTEEQWQKMLIAFLPLIFPKYIAVLQKVPVEDHYSTPGKATKRQIDIALVDVNGNLDVIEIKKPFDDVLLRKTRYRDNFVPTKDLSGTIMQVEKYLFHLSKWGIAGEAKLTSKFGSLLPPDMKIRITNPKGLVILGRDRKPDGSAALEPSQIFDLEVIRRKYANVIDIITYDDLLRRLESIIASLQRRSENGLDATKP